MIRTRDKTLACLVFSASLCFTSPLFAAKTTKSVEMNTDEARAEAVWKLRAGLNVAALQCQYDPALNMVDNYNQFLKLQKPSLDAARNKFEGYYKRRYGGGWAAQFDRTNTKLYNGFSATHTQVAFCTKMAEIGPLANKSTVLDDFAMASMPDIEAIFPKATPSAPAVKKYKSKKKSRSKKH